MSPADESADSETRPVTEAPAAPSKSPPLWPVVLVMMATFLVPYLFWKQTWFGAALTDEQVREKLQDRDKIRNVQHGLEQLSKRIQRDPVAARALYPDVPPLALHAEPIVRASAAWLMGQDPESREFHDCLRGLLGDAHVAVRYNAALALSRFRDRDCLPVLHAMLRPAPVVAEQSGVLKGLLDTGMEVQPLGVIAQIDGGGESIIEVAAPLHGWIAAPRLRLGETVAAGQTLCDLLPAQEQIMMCLQAFYATGAADDVPALRRWLEPSGAYTDAVRLQAKLAIAEIERRAKEEK